MNGIKSYYFSLFTPEHVSVFSLFLRKERWRVDTYLSRCDEQMDIIMGIWISELKEDLKRMDGAPDLQDHPILENQGFSPSHHYVVAPDGTLEMNHEFTLNAFPRSAKNRYKLK